MPSDLTTPIPEKLVRKFGRPEPMFDNRLVRDQRLRQMPEACWPKALRLDGSVRDPNALHVAVLERVRQRAHDFDVLH